ncbi:MAG: hypothetical protein HY709_02955 [Candidatus Latescibacteria bacterium]|nr:hypothetical protein [Candidatus Latescibacterota bacterium]
MPLVIAGLLWTFDDAVGEVAVWRLGGKGGYRWGDVADLNLVVDDFTVPGAIQPREFKPDTNLLPQLGPWYLFKFPAEPLYRPRKPRIWRGVNYRTSSENYPLVYVDGDPTTSNVQKDWHFWKLFHEFYTIDMGIPIPVERFVFYPPEGEDRETGEPYRPNYTPKKFELSGSLDVVRIEREEGDQYRPLDVMLASVEQNFDPIAEVRFPLQYLRFLRLKVFGDGVGVQEFISRLAYAEVEAYGRGFAPQATYESKVVDVGREVNFGRIIFEVSLWRKEGERVVPAPDAHVSASMEIKTGRDDTPWAYFGFNDQGELQEVTMTEYERLRQRIFAFDPSLVGWRGPITEDQKNWSFWSVPLRESGEQPGVPAGRYVQVRVQLKTEELWEYARVESLGVETLPLLVDRVVGEVGVTGNTQVGEEVALARIGEMTEFAYAMKAQFSGRDRPGFDAVRILTPSEAIFRRLEMGDPLGVVTPDSVRSEAGGLTVYLPRRVDKDASLRIILGTRLYTGSAKFEGEIFNRVESAVRQPVEEGDATDEISTNRLQVLTSNISPEGILGDVTILPRSITPNHDGRNDRMQITYMVSKVLEATIEITFSTLSGKRVRSINVKRQRAGRYTVEWEGLNDAGRPVAPGLYLCRIAAKTGRGTFETVHPVSVVY